MSEVKDNVKDLPYLAKLRELAKKFGEGNFDMPEALIHIAAIAKEHSVERGLAKTVFNEEVKKYKVRTGSNSSNTPYEEISAIIDEFNFKYAVVNEDGVAIVYQQIDDKKLKCRVLRRITFENLRKLYLNIPVTITLPGGRTITQTAADVWLAHPDRRQYLGGVTFDAANKHALDQWNLWGGFSVEAKPGDWSLMRKHIEEVICGGNREYSEYTLNWIARMFQFPDKQGEVAIVVRGKKGVGKGIVCRWIKQAFGQHGIQIFNAKHLVVNFNAHLRDCVFLFVDEAFFAGDRQHESVLKGLITEETIPVERKGKDVIEVVNTLHTWMASNSDYVVPATADERRYAVFDASDHRIRQFAYFKAINEQMDRGGLAAMVYDMLHRDITRFNVRDVPQTEALAEQKALNFDNINRWWYEVLCRGYVWESRHGAPIFAEWSDFASIDLLWASYEQWFGKHRKGYKDTRTQFKHSLDKIYGKRWCRPGGDHLVGEIERLPTPLPSPMLLDQVAPIRKPRREGYRFGPLIEARGVFQEHHNITGEWGRLYRVDELD